MAYIGKTPASAALTSSDISDGIIITDKLATNAVVTSKITDGTIATADVADNAINLAKMSSGTDGNIISYDTSGNPVAVATGNDGQVLTSAGAGAIPTFETLPTSGAMTLLSTASATGSEQPGNFVETVFSSTYNTYRVTFDEMKVSSPFALYLQVGTSSGILAGSSYRWTTSTVRGTESENNGSTGDSSFKLTGGDSSNDYKSNSNQGMISGHVDFYNPNTVGNTTCIGTLMFGNATDNGVQQVFFSGLILTTTQYDRWKISTSNGSFTNTTKIRTYGYNI